MHTYLGVIKSWLGLLVAAFLLTGCLGGDGGSSSTSISGTAATGAALTGTVDLVDANGVTRSTTIGTLGAFEIPTTGLSAPFILRATGNGSHAGVVLFSLADGTSGTFNITPLTHLALELIRQDDGAAPADLAALFAAWNAQIDPTDLAALQAALLQAQSVINANLATQMQANGLTPTTFDFLRTAFQPNSTGIDAVLDAISITINGNAITIGAGESNIPFIIDINVTGFNIGGSSGGGSGGGGSVACGSGETGMTFARNLQTAGPHTDGETVCFTATSSSLAFGSKTLTNPTQNQVVSLPFSAYTFSDSATGAKYEVVFNSGVLYEINVTNSSDAFHGQFTSASGNTGGGAGGVTLSITANGGGLADINIPGISAPASQNEFCAGMTDANSITSLNNALGAVGTFTITSCTFSGSVGTVNATLAITSPVAVSIPYVVTYTFN